MIAVRILLFAVVFESRVYYIWCGISFLVKSSSWKVAGLLIVSNCRVTVLQGVVQWRGKLYKYVCITTRQTQNIILILILLLKSMQYSELQANMVVCVLHFQRRSYEAVLVGCFYNFPLSLSCSRCRRFNISLDCLLFCDIYMYVRFWTVLKIYAVCTFRFEMCAFTYRTSGRFSDCWLILLPLCVLKCCGRLQSTQKVSHLAIYKVASKK